MKPALRHHDPSMSTTESVAPFRVQPHKTTLRPGIDARTLNRLVDELEDESVVAKDADVDFGRFEGVRWVNPLGPPPGAP